MNKLMDSIEKLVAPAANALSSNLVIQSISKGMMALMPVLMIGSFSSLFQSLPINAYQDVIKSLGIYNILGKLVNVTTNLLALYAVFCISYAFTKNKSEKNDAFAGSIIALLCYMIVTPLTVEGKGWTSVTNLPLSWLGAKGLFSAMIIAILSGYIYNYLLDKNISIKLPESVPPFVSKSFVGIIPGTVLSIIFAIIALIFKMTSFGDLHNAIYTIIGAPLSGLGGSVWAALLIYVLSGLCWFFGIHGIAVMSVVMPIWMAADAANVAAISAGHSATNIVTYNWVNVVANIGGAGCTLGLVVLMLLFAKSERYKAFSKIGIIPSLFGINEPVTFGLPCMLNAILFVPFVFTPVILLAIAYLLTVVGILPIGNGIGGPAGTPVLIAGMFNMGIRGVIWQIFGFLLSMLIYFPFFKILDNQALKEEQEMANKQ